MFSSTSEGRPRRTVLYIHTCTYVISYDSLDPPRAGTAPASEPGRAKRPHAERVAGVGRQGPVPLRLRQPGVRRRGARGRLYTRRAVPPIRGQGGSGPGGAAVGRRDVEARGRRG